MEKYNKDGRPFSRKQRRDDNPCPRIRHSFKPAFRDGRKYSEVLVGKQTSTKPDGDGKVIPFLFTVNVDENLEMGSHLKQAIVVENEYPIDCA
ncbi:unnamed protein product [Amaranthus hypochondriacus]